MTIQFIIAINNEYEVGILDTIFKTSNKSKVCTYFGNNSEKFASSWMKQTFTQYLYP